MSGPSARPPGTGWQPSLDGVTGAVRRHEEDASRGVPQVRGRRKSNPNTEKATNPKNRLTCVVRTYISYITRHPKNAFVLSTYVCTRRGNICKHGTVRSFYLEKNLPFIFLRIGRIRVKKKCLAGCLSGERRRLTRAAGIKSFLFPKIENPLNFISYCIRI